jgi:hypothetical protein
MLPRPGNYAGTALLIIDGSWVVSVGQYLGRTKEQGYQWKSVPIKSFFRLDVLRRQLQAAGLQVDVDINDDRCTFRFRNARGRVAPDGARIKRFLSQNYGSFNRRPVGWKWEIRQYD